MGYLRRRLVMGKIIIRCVICVAALSLGYLLYDMIHYKCPRCGYSNRDDTCIKCGYLYPVDSCGYIDKSLYEEDLEHYTK